MNELKPCPFCGAIPMMQHIAYPDTEFWFVKCISCSAEINNPRNSEEEAKKDWNKRLRCKDCKFGKESCGNIACHKPGMKEYELDYHPIDWFCADGELK